MTENDPTTPPRPSGVSRRGLLLGSAATLGGAFVTLGLAGCAPGATTASGASVEQLKFWHLLSGGDGVKMSTLVDQANAQNPELHATQTVLAWGTPYYTKLAMASAGGRAPDVAIMHASRVPGYAPGGLLDPWDIDKLASYGVKQSDFADAVWKKGFSGGKLYSVALDSHPFVLLYNTDIARKAGALDPDGRLVAFSRLEFRGKKWLYVATIASIIVPPQVLIVPLFYQMLAFDMVDTYWGIILPQAIAPAMVFVLKKFFDQVPIELEDAARVDGAGRIRIFVTILLPLSRPILGAVSIFVFIGAWNNFLWPFIVTNDASLLTLPVGLQSIKSAYGIQYAENMAAAILAAAPLILVFLFFQRQIIKGISTTGFGGQ
ncbi:extracellular solute-binding protein [Frigoribacterium sp. 2-23]|uniref:extracellular solute-binding protein n=1 Tax=Frigoribacterium sp. 2-23 TaxID=3415006 RepID=UPI003C6F292B